ncbi:MAG: fructoselysine 6-kinase [Clostridia bacterium]|nr:fructoselysine 6-kinase [Clostridia bacterium]MBQ6475796.1 fructoselysine 6-kinase [Clostridia bacterium]MBR0445028.1 fructoselysine 6-kinase [Clostridia bacterium]MCR5073944.1 fructoselysine 6-kinase [Clostridiales bacterium]
MKAAMIGDNCIDVYRCIDGKEVNRRYPTGNVVDTGVNLRKLGIPVSVISTTGSDKNGSWMRRTLTDLDMDLTRFKTGDGPTAITYMDMDGTERIHGVYEEGVMENIVFDDADISFAASHDLVHTALWGRAENTLEKIKKLNPSVLTSFDYCDRLTDPLIERTLPFVDYGFFSCHDKDRSFAEAFLKDKTDRGMKTAVATFGELGSLAYDGQAYTFCGIVPAERVVNTVGAGDSYIAGFLWGVLQGLPVIGCMKKGAEISSRVVQVFEPWVEE